MRIRFMLVVLAVLAGAIASRGQSASSPTQLVHPVLKDPNNRNAPTSLDRDPGMVQDPKPARRPAPNRPKPLPAAAQSAQPAVLVAKIDAGLAASKLALIGTIDGLKGTIYVTNIGAREITPVVELAVCDQKGSKIGAACRTGDALAPGADQKLVLLATNLNATDLKLMRLTTADAK